MSTLYEPLTDEHALAFGRVIASWAYLETCIGRGIDAALSVKMDHEFMIPSQLEYPKKRDLVRMLLPTDDELENILKEADRLNTIRRYVAHSIWVNGRKPKHIKPVGFKGRGNPTYIGLGHNEKEWSAEELNSEAAKMIELGNLFLDELDAKGFDQIGISYD